MSWMTSDRAWIFKLAGALGLFAWLCHRTNGEVSSRHPDIRRVPAYFEQVRGKTVYAWAYPVTRSEPDAVVIETEVGAMRVEGLTAPVGSRVSVRGTVIGPRTLQGISLQINEGYLWKRPLNYLVSFLTVAAVLWALRRRFRWRAAEGVFRSRY